MKITRYYILFKILEYAPPFIIFSFLFGIILWVLIYCNTVEAQSYQPQDLTEGYDYLNQVRQQTGMITLEKNAQLQTAAMNHAQYLTMNQTRGHDEVDFLTGFTGEKAVNRALNVGYQSRRVSENVIVGATRSQQSIDKLMSAIYHRFGFLDFQISNVGIGIDERNHGDFQYSAYVYNMGNSELNALCSQPGANRGYTDCANENTLIAPTAYDQALAAIEGNNPYRVLWPIHNAKNISPFFSEESPDPLPDYQISGYPVSLQFNPLVYEDVQVTRFELYQDGNDQRLTNTRQLNAETDPNDKFSSLEYALFPLDRLLWNTRYRAEVDYTANNVVEDSSETKTIKWEFVTQNPGIPMFTVQGQGETLVVPPNQSFGVFIPPTEDYLRITGYQWQGRGITRPYLTVNAIDNNTLQLQATGSNDSEIKVILANSDLTFNLEIQDSATLPSTEDDKGDGIDPQNPNQSTEDTSTQNCTAKDCTYKNIQFDTGFYVAIARLPSGSTEEGFWGLSVNTTSGSNPGGFNAGAILKENGETPGFVGFYLESSETINLLPFEYTGKVKELKTRLLKNGIPVYEGLQDSGEVKTVGPLEPGFYTAEVLSQTGNQRGRFGLSLNAKNFVGGVNLGGWIDSYTDGENTEGFGGFSVTTPQKVNLKLFFGDTYGAIGAGRLELAIYHQQSDGKRQLFWESP